MDAIEKMNQCTVLTLKEKLGQEALHLVDVREYAEYAGGRIAGATLLPLGEIEERYAELDRERTIYVICRTGRRSGEAQKKLETLGFKHVVNVMGGFEAWKKQNLPFEKDENAPWALERQVRLTAGILILLGVGLTIFVHSYFLALPAFVGAGLTFAGATDWCGMALLLAKMPWNREFQSCRKETAATN